MPPINENQKKLLEEIKNPVFNMRRMNLMVQLLCLIVEDNTIEKTAKETLVKLIKTDREIQEAIKRQALRVKQKQEEHKDGN